MRNGFWFIIYFLLIFEWSFHTLNVTNIDPCDLRETYLPAFKALVREADVREIMCAYQHSDEKPCRGNISLLKKILYNAWNFNHLAIADCRAISDYSTHQTFPGAIHIAVTTVITGTDIECAGNCSKR